MADFHGYIPQGSFWLPKASSNLAGDIDAGWALAYWVSVFFFFIIVIPLVIFVWRYRRKKPGEVGAHPGHNTPLEIAWSVAPLIIVMACFLVGFQGFVKASVPPKTCTGGGMGPDCSYEINVTGQKWLWTFFYPNGANEPGELRVPAGQDVRLIMSSKDVIHSFFIPEFRVKQDVVPGSYSSVWFQPLASLVEDDSQLINDGDRKGADGKPVRVHEMTVECAEYCGKDHSNMLARLVVMKPDDFTKWLEEEGKASGGPPEELGKKLFTKLTCVTCHSLTSTPIPGGGPAFKDVFGRTETMSDGLVLKVDENYIKESILYPQAKIVKGFGPIMPSFKGQLKDYQINALIAYIKTIK